MTPGVMPENDTGKPYLLYILLCCDGSLYTGIATDLKARLRLHALGKGSKYVRARLPFTHIYTEKLETKSQALKRELEIKSWDRQTKIKNLGLNLNTGQLLV